MNVQSAGIVITLTEEGAKMVRDVLGKISQDMVVDVMGLSEAQWQCVLNLYGEI